MNAAATPVSEQEISDACLSNALFLPIARWWRVAIVRDEHGYGCTLTDSAAVGLGATASEALHVAIVADVAGRVRMVRS